MLQLKRMRRGIPVGKIVDAIAATMASGNSSSEIVCKVYDELSRPKPNKPAQVMQAWRAKINKLLAAGDPSVLELCRDVDIVEEEVKVRRAKK